MKVQLTVTSLEDRLAPAVSLVTINAEGTASGSAAVSELPNFPVPATSDDGRFVVFQTPAIDLVSPSIPIVPTGNPAYAFWRDTQTNQTQWLSATNHLVTSDHPSISADGRYVAFFGPAGLAPDVSTYLGGGRIYLRDTTTGATVQVTANGTQVEPGRPQVSPDGRYVAFSSRSAQVGSFSPVSGREQVYLWDSTTGQCRMVSTAGGSETTEAGGAGSPILLFSADSSTLFFRHTGNNIVSGVSDTNNIADVFAFDIASGVRSLVSVNAAGTGAASSGADLYGVSGDGRYAVMSANDGDLVSAPQSGTLQSNVFLRDRTTNTTIRVSQSPSGTITGGSTGTVSRDGKYVVFGAGPLLPGLNNAGHVYRYEVATGKLELVNVRPDGTPGGGASPNGSFTPMQNISADGRFVAFVTTDSSLIPGGSGSVQQLYVRDMTAGVTSLISHSISGTAIGGNNASRSPSISTDGSRVTFYSRATDLTSQTDANLGNDFFSADVPAPGQSGVFQLDSATRTIGENGVTLTLTVSRTGGTYGLTHVPYHTTDGTAKAGMDFVSASGNLVFLNGQTSATINITITNNVLQDGNRNFSVSLDTPLEVGTLGALAQTAVTIQDDEPPTTVAMLSKSFSVGAGAGGSTVQSYNPDGTARFSISPFGAFFTGGVRVAEADFTGDGVAETVAATGPGINTRVIVFDGATQAVIFDIAPFEAAFQGGLFVAVGDLTGDGVPDIVVTPDEGGGPAVAVYDGANLSKGAGSQVYRFFGIEDPNFRGGARAAVADITGDGRLDLLVAAGFGGGPRLSVWDGTSGNGAALTRHPFGDFFVFEQTLRNGVYIAGGDLNGDGFDEIIAGGGPGGGPRIFALSGKDLSLTKGQTQTVTANFFAGDQNGRGGVRITAKDLDGDNKADLVTGAGTGSGSGVTAYSGAAFGQSGLPASILEFTAFGGFSGGVFVG